MSPWEKELLGSGPWLGSLGPNYLGAQEWCVYRAIYRARHCWWWQRHERLASVRRCHELWRESRAIVQRHARLRSAMGAP